MANYFAIKSGNWDDTTVWDSGIIPTSADTVFTNGYVVTVNSDVDVNQLRNGSSNGQLPNNAVPTMTSNTTPSGIASASVNTASAWKAFGGGGWAATGSAYTLTYQFSSPKMIKRFRIIAAYNNTPNAFTFQGSNDPTFATIDFSYAAAMPNVPNNTLISPLLNNLTSCLYYRINVTTSIGSTPTVFNFDMTESSAVTNSGTGGNYLVSALPTAPSTRTITLRDSTTGLQNASGNVNLLQISAPSGIININHATLGNIVGGGALVASQYNIYASPTSACTININGNLFGDTVTSGGAARNNAAFGIEGGITANIIGTLTAGNMYASNNGSSAVSILTGSGNAVVNITGNLFGQSASFSGVGSEVIYAIGNNATINITGNVTANLYYAIRCTATYTGNINITTGTVTASSTAIGIYNLGTGIVTLFSPIINNTNTVGVMSQRIRFYQTGVSQWRFQDQTGANLTIYSGSGGGMGYPEVDTVRFGSPAFGPSGEYSGTMRIPDVTNVNKGVEYGYNLVGTAVLTAEDFLDAISTSTNPMAIRLKNLSTTQTMGDQLSGFSNA